MSPSGDGVVGDVEGIKVFHKFGELIGRDGMKDGEIKDERDRRLIEGHFRPGELDSEVRLDAIDRILGNFKRLSG